MYEFKIGDEVEVVRSDSVVRGSRFIVASIQKGASENTLIWDADVNSWFTSSLKLVCPAGYRPVREDEMDESPQKGDAWLNEDGLRVVYSIKLDTTFREYVSMDGEPWFRPLTTPAVETWDNAKAEEPVVKEHNNWGWLSGTIVCGMNMTEVEAKTAASEYTDDQRFSTLVFKVMGEYSARTEITWTPNDE